MKAREIIRLLTANGWQQVRQKGSHRIFRNPNYPDPVVVPDHAGDLKPGTLNEILKKAGLKK